MPRQVHSEPTTWGAELAKANNNAQELYEATACISPSAAVDSASTPADNDAVVVKRSGAMSQLAFSRVWAYISAKITGAISGVITSDLAISKALASNSSGKVTASAVDSSELSVLDGDTTDSGVTPVDSDKFIINDAGVMRQTNFARLMDYINSKLPAQAVRAMATVNMPASGESNTDLVTNYKGFKIWFNVSSTNAKIFVARTDNGEMILTGYLYAVGTAQWNKQTGAMEVVSITKSYGNTGGKVGRFLFNTSPAGNGSPIVAEISLMYVDTDKVTYQIEVY